jgi:hypothetical protein
VGESVEIEVGNPYPVTADSESLDRLLSALDEWIEMERQAISVLKETLDKHRKD